VKRDERRALVVCAITAVAAIVVGIITGGVTVL